MARLLFENARLVTPVGPLSPGWLVTEGRRIAALGPGRAPAPAVLGAAGTGALDGQDPHGEDPHGQDLRGEDLVRVDCGGLSLYPGFIDVHAHGAVGVDVMDADPDGLRRVARFYATHGVTAWTPTTWTRPPDDTRRAVEAIASVTGPVDGGAVVLGAHLEGPWVNARRAGAQDVEAIRVADRAELEELLGTGAVRLVAVAPEVEGNEWVIAECARRGVTVSIGHSDATYEQARQAVAAGARQVTHTFNAMRPFGHREAGLAGAALTIDELRCELIADNVHVSPVAMDLLVRAKRTRAGGRPTDGHPSEGGVVLVTDAIRVTGLPDKGTFDLGGRSGVMDGGVARLPDGTIAGSVLTMDRAVANLHAATGLPPVDLARAASLAPAAAAGVADAKGSLAAGKDADLVLLDQDFRVVATVVEGTVVSGHEAIQNAQTIIPTNGGSGRR